ncbi:BrnA antitoxin family protein [Candidatus Binatia bacterium]|nr:BrnA antitoxin family protein [Candidatus Binatia bacterium]
MKPRSAKKADAAGVDAQIREFRRRDLGEDIARSGAGKVLRRTRTTSIALSEDLIAKLRAKGAKRGLGYQTLLKMIVMEHVDEY